MCPLCKGQPKTWDDAHKYCLHYGAELLSWRTEAEWLMTSFYWAEIEAVTGTRYSSWSGAIRDDEWGDWVWGNVTDDLVPLSFGWYPGHPEACKDRTEEMCAFNSDSRGLACGLYSPCIAEYEFTCEKDVQK